MRGQILFLVVLVACLLGGASDTWGPVGGGGTHTIASHSDTTATGAETETLTDGSNADALHVHTGAGVSAIDISADTNLAVTGPVILTDDTLSISEYAPIATSTGGALAINTATLATAAADYDLPDECDTATGAWAMVIVQDAAETVSLTVDDADATPDTIVYKGLALDADDELDSPGAAQDSVTVVCMKANEFWATDNSGAWTDGGVPD